MDITEETKQETDRFVWYDEQNHKKFFRRGAVLLVIAVIAGLLFYFPLRQYRGTVEASIGLFCVVLVILGLIFRKWLTNNMATYVRYEDDLYCLWGANRGITRIAMHNEEESPYFERDFGKAQRANSCWHILQVELLEENKKGYRVFCRICKSKSGKECHVNFYLEQGYNDWDQLLEELNRLKK